MSKKGRFLLPFLAAPALAFAGGMYLYQKFVRTTHEIHPSPLDLEYAQQIKETYDEEIISFTSFDGLALKAYLYRSAKRTHRYVILVHGYFGSHFDMMRYAIHYLEKGFHVLMPELRGHGVSEGDYVGFGYFEHVDIQGYISLLVERDKKAQIILHGMSMGAATVTMVAGEYLPDNVKAVIADAGFTNAYEQCACKLRDLYHLPAFPVMPATDMILKKKVGYSLKDADPLTYVKDAVVPMLFIHGAADDFVPSWMLDPLYEACGSALKEKLLVPGATHVASSVTEPALFWSTVDAFIKKAMA